MENPKFIVMFSGNTFDGKDFQFECTITMGGDQLNDDSEEHIKSLLDIFFKKWEVNISNLKIIDLKKMIS